MSTELVIMYVLYKYYPLAQKMLKDFCIKTHILHL